MEPPCTDEEVFGDISWIIHNFIRKLEHYGWDMEI